MHGERLQKMSRRDAMARDPRRDLLGRDRDILLRDRDEIRDASVRDRDETLVPLETVSRPSRDRDVSTETTSLLEVLMFWRQKSFRARQHLWAVETLKFLIFLVIFPKWEIFRFEMCLASNIFKQKVNFLTD